MTGGTSGNPQIVALTRTDPVFNTVCAVCGLSVTESKSETLGHWRAPECGDRFDCSVTGGSCARCGTPQYFLCLDVVSDVPDGFFFDHDDGFGRDEPEWYEARLGDRTWRVYHCAPVTSVSFAPKQTGASPLRKDCAWVDFHVVGPVKPFADNDADRLKELRALAASLQPVIAAIKW